jgi:hypothetical protein
MYFERFLATNNKYITLNAYSTHSHNTKVDTLLWTWDAEYYTGT